MQDVKICRVCGELEGGKFCCPPKEKEAGYLDGVEDVKICSKDGEILGGRFCEC